MEKKEDEKNNNNFLFRNSIIVIFIYCESLLRIGDSKYIYISGEILNICLFIGVNISLGLSISRNGNAIFI